MSDLYERARELDAADQLAALRSEFVLDDDVVYLDGNSLGALPANVPGRIDDVVRRQWGELRIRSWSESGWWTAPERIGDLIAPIVGAGPGQVVVGDSTSVNVFKALVGAVRLAGGPEAGRDEILVDAATFPTDGYIAASVARMTGCSVRGVEPGEVPEAVGERTAAVLLEPIQGESGVHPTSDEALLAAREACDEVGALLILDEIQTGVGRTGSLWAYQQTPVRPDVLTSAKALGGGVPIGACITAPRAADVLEPGDHGSTFAGAPLAAAAAMAVLDVVDDPALLRRVRELGSRLRDGLEALPGVRETRGRGLMVGVGLEPGTDAAAVGSDLLARGLVVNVPAPGTLRLLPPLLIDSDHVDRAVALIGESLLGFAR